MLIYRDIVTNDELFTDSAPITFLDNGLVKIKCRYIKVDNSVSAAAIGGNPSEEAPDEDTEDAVERKLDVVDGCKLQQTASFASKKELVRVMKGLLKRIMDKIDCPITKEEFKNTAPKALKFLKENYEEFECYVGESPDSMGEGVTMFLKWEDNEDKTSQTPYFYTFKHAVIEEKA